MTPKAILKAAREILSKPERWTQGCFARTLEGEEVLESSPHAVCFCAVGAVLKVDPSGPYLEAWDLLEQAARGPSRGEVARYNDAPRRTHKQILAWFDRAIAKA